MRTLTASERQTLIRLASSLPKGSEERNDILLFLQYSKPVRGASVGSVRYAFSVAGLVSDFFGFFAELGERTEKLSEMLSKAGLDPQDEDKINKACELAAKALNKALATPVKQEASLDKKSNLLGVAILASSMKAAGRRNPEAMESVSAVIIALPLLLALGLTLGPIYLALKTIETVFQSAKYAITGEESSVHDFLKHEARALIKYAETKKGFVQKALKFLSKFVHSKPSPDPFSEKGAVFELYGMYNTGWFQGHHPYGKMTLDQAEKTLWNNPIPYHYLRASRGDITYWLFDTVEKNWWGYDSEKRIWQTAPNLGYNDSKIKNLLGEEKPLDFRLSAEPTLTRVR